MKDREPGVVGNRFRIAPDRFDVNARGDPELRRSEFYLLVRMAVRGSVVREEPIIDVLLEQSPVGVRDARVRSNRFDGGHAALQEEYLRPAAPRPVAGLSSMIRRVEASGRRSLGIGHERDVARYLF